ncbi:MAG: molybdopterin-dependent oxidoreductase [Desulfobacteraceae bacterium]|nr:molybdopterin-dependent oxidoreductase [Desulfobacteraceae bacterium]
MKVDRRSFLGLGLGAAAGIAVSPAALKLMDDSSIWSQNWSWTPVPVDGEVTYESSVCSLCPGNCGISVRKIDNRPVKIEGSADYPINNGGACLHGIAGLQYLYDPARIKTPLKKNGDKFEAVSWDDAISYVAGKLKDIRKSGSSEKLACITDKDQGSVSNLFKRLLKAFGSPNHYTMPSLESYLELTASTVHNQDATIGYDLANADFVLSFGAGLIEGWGSPVNCFKTNASRKERHAKLYQIEPRLSNTAANADKWIPIKPGTEADLALGLCSVILKEKLFNSEFSVNFKNGFSKLTASLVSFYSPAKVSEMTGIKAEDIKKLAVRFAKSKMSLAIPGKGRGASGQNLKELAAVHTLNCLVGNINQKGGAWINPLDDYLNFPNETMDSIAKKGYSKKKLGNTVTDFFAKINASDKPVIDTLFVYNANPCFSLHDTKNMKEVIKKIPFVVSFSSFFDETAMEADVILPSHFFLERIEDVPSGSGLASRVVGLSKPIIDPIFDTKHPGDTILDLANAIEGTVAESFSWENYEECLAEVAGDIWDTLDENGYAVISDQPSTNAVNVDFKFLAANPDTIQAQGDLELTLIPIDNMRITSAAPASSPFAIKTVSDRVILGGEIFVEINPETAKDLSDGSDATLTTPMGSALVKINFNEGIMPGVIGMVQGLGHTFGNEFIVGKGVNINNLIGPVIEAGSGLDAAFGIKASISKV